MAPADWASLPSDLVCRVAEVLLVPRDVDYYMSLRAVCRNWRAATDDPRCRDPRFSPRGWVLVSSLPGDHPSGRRALFLHVDTGRLLWKDMPMLCNYSNVAGSTENGHLVLDPLSRSTRICLLNPITGHLVRFPITPAQFHLGKQFGLRLRRKTMFGAGSSPMVLYTHFDTIYGGCIDPSWDVVFNQESLFNASPALGLFATMVPFKGRAYAMYRSGSVVVVEHNCRLDEKPVVTTVVTNRWNWMDHRRMFLVDNAGELLLVRLLASEELLVFRVDVENRVLEQIKSVGNRAIFLGDRRCISVDACNLPAIECDCLYYIGTSFGGGICVHRVNDGSHMVLSEYIGTRFGGGVDAGQRCPKSLARVLMEYVCFGNMT